MINEEVSNRTISVQVRALKSLARAILRQLKKISKEAKKHGGLEKYIKKEGNEIKLKDMAKKGQLEEIPVKDQELKELRKELNKYGVKFSVMRDKKTGEHTVFFQSRDLKMMELAFNKAVEKSEKKHDRKESINKQINQFKEKIKNTIDKDKVKNKQKEQSL
ncbi:PcfB family protein [Facklamia sp. P9177]|uniref:PcfB family protein n=1 Tax=Facklamia sp. P9177 TaxID=3421945 RepID=UPI003D17E78B